MSDLVTRVAALNDETTAAATEAPVASWTDTIAGAREAFVTEWDGGEPSADRAADAVLAFQREILTAAKGWESAGFPDVDPPANATDALRDVASGARSLHAEGVDAFAAGDAERAVERMTAAVAESIDLDLLNDLAVIAHAAGREADALSLLRTCLALDPDRADARENLDAIEGAGR